MGITVPEHAHLPDWTLDLLAEDALPHAERTAAEAHLRSCPPCAAELDAARAVIASLNALPTFSPAPDFAEAVMARVVLKPAVAPELARSRRWLPRTTRGWMLAGAGVMAPLAPLATLLAWLLSHRMVTLGGLWSMGETWASDTAWAGLTHLLGAIVGSSAFAWASNAAERLVAASSGELGMAALLYAVAIPLSGWALVRLLRAPTGGVTHAS
jgi:anti-sigma factor RsiW